MSSVPSKVADRLIAGIKRFQPILSDAKKRDAGEADTVTIIIEMLADVFGYDKFSEITAEHAIKSQFCDLAIKLDGTVSTLIEAKAIGFELKDNHVVQAVNYAANQGVDWVILTNGISWRIYHVTLSKTVTQDKVVDINFLELKPKDDFEKLYLWSKEGWKRTALDEYEAQQQARSPFLIAATILSEPILEVVRRQFRKVAKLNKVSSEIRIDLSQIEEIIARDVLKREVLEDPKANDARKKIERAAKVSLHETDDKDQPEKLPLDKKPSDQSATVVSPESTKG
ncbi:MAG TPA: type I restriction enzyme HsdR N-terminal domain-containing protein [Candidatus Methylacidiphilales bacterium]|nr:type I restriction enzyme HsdR N-terminal domain-containing protein [Candidatus Methylacidiphilales bacterium]